MCICQKWLITAAFGSYEISFVSTNGYVGTILTYRVYLLYNYRLWGNEFTESKMTRLHQAEQERKKLTGFEKLSLYIAI